MSFSSDTKNELIKIKNANAIISLCELMGALAYGGRLRRGSSGLELCFFTENPKIARRVFQLYKDGMGINSKIKIKRGITGGAHYSVCVYENDVVNVLIQLEFIFKPSDINYFERFRVFSNALDKPYRCKAFLRGAFLVCGSVMSPSKKYHMEFVTPSYGLCNDLYAVMKCLGLNPKTVVRSGNLVIYFKSSEEIADILTLMGSYSSLMEFHNTKIIKEIRNGVNRTINCEKANMEKMINASVEQVCAIETIIANNAFETLPENLKEVARVRLENRECSLKELGEMLSPPLGKSGVNHRLRKLQEIADKFK